MNATDILRFLHVLSAIAWVGGGVMLQSLLAMTRRAGPEAVAGFNRSTEWVHRGFFMPVSFAALASGIVTVVVGTYDWSAVWINIGFLGFASSAIIGMAGIGPTSKKLQATIDERGAQDAAVGTLTRRMATFGLVELAVLIVVVFFMVVKPA